MKTLLAGIITLFYIGSTYAAGLPPLAGMTILVLGESHMSINYLIAYLPEDLVEQGAKVYSYGAWGAKPSSWLTAKAVPTTAFRIDDGPIRERPSDIAKTQPVGELIDKHHPDLVLLIFGDTLGSYTSKTMPRSWIWQEVSGLTKEINAHGTQCVWVGPPWGQEGGKYNKTSARVKEFSDYLSTIVSPCIYVDSLTFSRMGEWKTVDGQHFDRWGYKGWARAITNAIISPEILSRLKQ